MPRLDERGGLPSQVSRRIFLQAAALSSAVTAGWKLLWPNSVNAGTSDFAPVDARKTVLKGVTRAKGYAEGEALVSEQPISWAPFAVPNNTGIISIFGHKLTGQSVKDKIVVYPTVYGSTTGSMGLFFKVKESRVGPKAIICRNVHPIDLGGAIAAEIPAVDGLNEDPIHAIQTGDWVTIQADEVGKEATVTIIRKAQRPSPVE